MPRTTPFHARLAPQNQPQIWKHWSGYLSAPRYQYSAISEYYAIRNSVALFDTSPLFKYQFSGREVVSFLRHVLTRDVQSCAVGQAQYTLWCNEDGFVLEDGVILRITEDQFWLTSAEPNFRYFNNLAKEYGVTVEDISEQFGILALQGPHARTVLNRLTNDLDQLGYFKLVQTTIADCPVTISRTGYTGDLGYEVWISAENALPIFDAIWHAGRDYNLTPIGTTALMFARIEAGLLLLDVDFYTARFAWVDAQRERPHELGLGWMMRGLRDFIGRTAIKNSTPRWHTVGIAVDWHDYERIHRDAGIMPPKEGVLVQETMSVYRPNSNFDYLGYVSSFCYSSLLKKHIGIAKIHPDYASVGTDLELEISVIRKPAYVRARVVPLPFYTAKNLRT